VLGEFTTDTFTPKSVNNYSMSKKHFLEYAKKMILTNSSATKFINMRIEHMYGPDDNPTKLIPTLIFNMRSGLHSMDFTSGKQLRDFVYVDDVVSAFSAVMNNPPRRLFSKFQVGTGKRTSIKDMIILLKSVYSSNMQLNFGVLSFTKNDTIESCADISSLSKIGWSPKVGLEDGLKATVEWYIKKR
jgi:nucleoside-diphosphate-sugar epimerase